MPMKNSLPFLLALLLILPFSSCSHRQTSTGKATVIDLLSGLNNTKDIKLSDIADEITYIPLETKADCMLSSDLSLTATDEGYIMLEGGIIFRVFDKDGKFIRNVGSSGKGPGEYLRARQFSIDKKARVIEVASIFTLKMVLYSFEGKFLREYPMPFDAAYVVKEPSGGYHLATYRPQPKDSAEYRFSRMDNQGKIVQIFPEKGVVLPSSGIMLKEFQYYTYNDQVYLQNAFNDTIYRFTKGAWVPDLYFDLGSFSPPKEYWDDIKFNAKNRGQFIERVGFTDEQDYLLVFFRHKKKSEIGKYDKASKTLTYVQNIDTISRGFLNDLDGGPGVKPLWNENDGKYWYLTFQAVDLIDWKAKGYFDQADIKHPEQNKKLKAMIDRLTVDSNPVIMKVRQKK
jgi:hypothetical protein